MTHNLRGTILHLPARFRSNNCLDRKLWFTLAPCKPEHRDLNMLNLTKVEGMSYEALKEGIDWNYKTYNDYLNLLENKN